MPTISGITYQERPGSGTLEYSPEGIVGRRIFIVNWEDRIEFCRVMLGYTSATGHVPIRTAAQKFPGFDYLYCTHAKEQPLGELRQGPEMAEYPQVEIHCEYHPWNLSISPTEHNEEETITYLEESYEFGGEFISVPGSNFRWVDTVPTTTGTGENPNIVDMPIGRLVGTLEMLLHSPWEPELKGADIRATYGKVNDVEFFDYPAEHVLFMGASARRVITSEGTPGWAVTYRFRAREASWNYVFRGDTDGMHPTGWWEVTPHPYETADFSVLFD